MKTNNTADYFQNKIAVSVIIPVYNAEKWLTQCLTSVCIQTLSAIEIICINDGSHDNSLAILKKFGKQDTRFRIYNCQNSGAANARNFGLERALGEYVAFLDADDYYPNADALMCLYHNAKEQHMPACGGLRLLDFSGEIRQHPLHRNIIEQFPLGTTISYADFQEDYHYHGYIYSTALIKQYHLRFPNLTRYEDPVFFFYFMIRAKQFWVIPQAVYCYRKKTTVTHLSAQQTIDAIIGITKNLQTSSTAKLAKLHYSCIQRLNKEYREDILQNMQTPARNRIYQELLSANNSQDYLLIQTILKEYATGKPLSILGEVQQYIKPTYSNNIFTRGIKCIKDHGLLYTLKYIWKKFLP